VGTWVHPLALRFLRVFLVSNDCHPTPTPHPPPPHPHLQRGPLVMCASSSLYAQLGTTAPQHPRWAWSNPIAPTLAYTHAHTLAPHPLPSAALRVPFSTHTHTHTHTLPAALGCAATPLVDATLRLASLPPPDSSGVCLPVSSGAVLPGRPEHGAVHTLPCRHLWCLHLPHDSGLLRPLRRGVRAFGDHVFPPVAASPTLC
jgi:hypothetical protein